MTTRARIPLLGCFAALTLAFALASCGGCPDAPEPVAADSADLTARFGGGFRPSAPGVTGFGGGACKAERTPVVFLHGNASRASDWAIRASDGGPSVLAIFRAAGYRDCELYGLDWLTPAEQKGQQYNYHTAARAELVRGFLDDVRRATGKAQVDLVGHSMGVTLGLLALEDPLQLAGVRRFVGIAGGLRGLQTCLVVGPANPLATTCGSQNLFDPETFGFFPLANPRMEKGGFRDRPAQGGPRYYTIRAGESDQFLAPGYDTAKFDDSVNVWAQLDVGQGHPTFSTKKDDGGAGIGHYRAKTDSGQLQLRLLTTDCRGDACCQGTSSVCR
jgi:pimeloyl-ACP methyl ester carboxylesterase